MYLYFNSLIVFQQTISITMCYEFSYKDCLLRVEQIKKKLQLFDNYF